MTTLVDTNILIALVRDDDRFHQWSLEQFAKCRGQGPALITDIVYCEFSIGMASKDFVDAAIGELAIQRYRTDDEALFRAGVAFKRYRDENKGPKTNVLPDFLIGAVAEVANVPLLTVNPKDYGSYFPSVTLICP